MSRLGNQRPDIGRDEAVPIPHRPSDLCQVLVPGNPAWRGLQQGIQFRDGADDVTAEGKTAEKLRSFEEAGFGQLPICMAKTQYSFSTDPEKRGAPSDHMLKVREVRLSAGAEFVVVIAGDIMTMPGLPRTPAADKIHLNEKGQIEGLF